jgi:hypothetical protein
LCKAVAIANPNSKKHRTAELTWGETANDNSELTNGRFYEASCPALTSNDLLDAALG